MKKQEWIAVLDTESEIEDRTDKIVVAVSKAMDGVPPAQCKAALARAVARLTKLYTFRETDPVVAAITVGDDDDDKEEILTQRPPERSLQGLLLRLIENRPEGSAAYQLLDVVQRRSDYAKTTQRSVSSSLSTLKNKGFVKYNSNTGLWSMT